MIKMIILAVSIIGSADHRSDEISAGTGDSVSSLLGLGATKVAREKENSATDIEFHEVEGFTSIEVCEVQKKQVEEQFKEGQSAAVRVTAVCLEVS